MQSIILACGLNRTAKACAVDFLKMEDMLICLRLHLVLAINIHT